jgi:ribosomal protein S27AE
MTYKQSICPRCGGSLFLERDEYDQHLYCLQCGFRKELKVISKARNTTDEDKREILPSAILKSQKEGRTQW